MEIKSEILGEEVIVKIPDDVSTDEKLDMFQEFMWHKLNRIQADNRAKRTSE